MDQIVKPSDVDERQRAKLREGLKHVVDFVRSELDVNFVTRHAVQRVRVDDTFLQDAGRFLVACYDHNPEDTLNFLLQLDDIATGVAPTNRFRLSNTHRHLYNQAVLSALPPHQHKEAVKVEDKSHSAALRDSQQAGPAHWDRRSFLKLGGKGVAAGVVAGVPFGSYQMVQRTIDWNLSPDQVLDSAIISGGIVGGLATFLMAAHECDKKDAQFREVRSNAHEILYPLQAIINHARDRVVNSQGQQPAR